MGKLAIEIDHDIVIGKAYSAGIHRMYWYIL